MKNVFVVYKDPNSWQGSSRPWTCDMIMPNDPRCNKWAYGYKTKTSLIRHIQAIDSGATIVRGADYG